MTNIESISWPKDFPELKKLDNLLRCGICYDYMKTSMITSCSHNYCSLCIRKYMHYKSACPICFEETYEVYLRNNRPLDDIISVFLSIRDKIIRHLKIATVHLPKLNEPEKSPAPASLNSSKNVNNSISKNIEIPNEQNEDSVFGLFNASFSKTTKYAKENSTIKGKKVVRKLEKDPIENDVTSGIDILPSPSSSKVIETRVGSPFKKIPSMFYSPKKCNPNSSPVASTAKTVSCPVCGVDIPERNINVHLDSCLARDKTPPKKSPKFPKREPIPKRVYSMMSEKDLRKWLKIYNLNTGGDKKVLISRLQRFTVLYNSECDSDNPRSSNEIIRQVEKEEKDEKMASSGLGVIVKKPINRNSDPNLIEVENKNYIDKNKSHFESLINSMRARYESNIKPTHAINRIDSDNEDENAYCLKETEVLVNNNIIPSTSTGLQCNGISLDKKKSKENINDIKGISVSPILGNAWSTPKSKNSNDQTFKSSSKRCIIFDKNNSIVEKNDTPLKVKEEYLEDEQLQLSNTSIQPEKHNLNEITNGNIESDDSNHSISLLAELNQPKEECLSLSSDSTESESLLKPAPESQINDPNFIVTDSEILEANNDNSEDVFVPLRRLSKRLRPDVNDELPKRVLRRKRNN